MTKDEKISNFERVLSWLPEAFKSWATSNPFLSSTLNEVLNERDTRLSGTPCTNAPPTSGRRRARYSGISFCGVMG